MIQLSSLPLRFQRGCGTCPVTQQWLFAKLGTEFRSSDPCQGFCPLLHTKRASLFPTNRKLNHYSAAVFKYTCTHTHMRAHIHTHNSKEYPRFTWLRNNLHTFLNLPKRSGAKYHLNGKCHGKVSGSKRRVYCQKAWWPNWTGETKVEPEGRPYYRRWLVCLLRKARVQTWAIRSVERIRQELGNVELLILKWQVVDMWWGVPWRKVPRISLVWVEDKVPKADSLVRTRSLLPDVGKAPCVVTCCHYDLLMVPTSSPEWKDPCPPLASSDLRLLCWIDQYSNSIETKAKHQV